jgi:hypothetical protein
LNTVPTHEPYEVYCPICQRVVEAINAAEVMSGLEDAYVYIHDNLDHTMSDVEALSMGIH